MCESEDILKVETLSYTPQHNGRIERWHRSLKKSLRAYILNNKETWTIAGLEQCHTQYIDDYNQFHIHSALKMTPNEYLTKIHVTDADFLGTEDEVKKKLAQAVHTYQTAKKRL